MRMKIIITNGALNESNVETLLGEPDVNDFDNIFSLGDKAI